MPGYVDPVVASASQVPDGFGFFREGQQLLGQPIVEQVVPPPAGLVEIWEGVP